MLYFIPWVVFIVIAIIAVPIAAVLDKKKGNVDFGDNDMNEAFDDMSDEDALEDIQEEAEEVDDFGAEPLPAAEGFDDDLSAFE